MWNTMAGSTLYCFTCQRDIEKSPSGRIFLLSPWTNIEYWEYWEILTQIRKILRKVHLVGYFCCHPENVTSDNLLVSQIWMQWVLKSMTNTSFVVLTWFSNIVFWKCLPALAFSGVANIALNQTTADFVVTYATSSTECIKKNVT